MELRLDRPLNLLDECLSKLLLEFSRCLLAHPHPWGVRQLLKVDVVLMLALYRLVEIFNRLVPRAASFPPSLQAEVFDLRGEPILPFRQVRS